MQRLINIRFVVLLLVFGFVAIFPQCTEAQTRPTPMGVYGGNTAFAFDNSGRHCFSASGTFGALVADQNGTQYILGAAHVFAQSATGFFETGSQQPIVQPQLLNTGGHLGLTGGCTFSPSLISGAEVATLSAVVPPIFTGAVGATDAAIAQVIPGKASSSIAGISQFSGTELTVVKKGLLVEKVGAQSGLTKGFVISKMLMTERVRGCQRMTRTGKDDASCGVAVYKVGNAFQVRAKSGHFSVAGDSGSLVLTQGPCPQPVGILIAGTAADPLTTVGAIGPALTALKSAGGYSSLSVVSGGGGCTPSTAEVEDTATGDVSLEDPTVADPDVAEALVARADMLSNDSLLTLAMNDGDVDGVGIDLSGSTAALDIIFDSSYDLNNFEYLFPTSYEGVAVEEDVIHELDLSTDTTKWGSGSD